ncbi:MAG: M23 family metallopeptidase [Peptococcaceae bacterium]|nr:M23 family metallopeptidase [Peptococcaceae bacterium]
MSSLPYKKKFMITQTFLNPNPRYESGLHLGVDLVGLTEKTVYAINHGTVFSAGYESAFGNTVIIKQQDNLYARYSHLERILVKINETVTAGMTIIGIEGQTGFVYGGSDPRHLDLRISKVPVYTDSIDAYLDPCEYLGFDNKLNAIINPEGFTMTKYPNIVLYFSEVDRRAALYLADYFNCPAIDLKLLPVEIIDQVFESVYVIGTAQKPVARAVNLYGEDRFQTCKKVLDLISGK